MFIHLYFKSIGLFSSFVNAFIYTDIYYKNYMIA